MEREPSFPRYPSRRTTTGQIALPPQPARLVVLLVAAVLALSVLASCQGTALVTPQPETIRVAGSTSFPAALRDLSEAYQAQHPNVIIDLRQSGTEDGIGAVSDNRADLAAVSWQPGSATPPPGVRAAPLARDAVALIVHPDNKVSGLTLLQAKSLYQGEVQDWQALGGPALEPVMISREDGSGTRAAFESMVMDNDRVTLNALIMPSTEAVVDYVATHPAAIGYVSLGAVDERVKVLKVEDVQPSATSVQNGSYRLARLIYLYRAPAASPAAGAFADFLQSPTGQAIIARHHVSLR